jgi:hypothetical protein
MIPRSNVLWLLDYKLKSTPRKHQKIRKTVKLSILPGVGAAARAQAKRRADPEIIHPIRKTVMGEVQENASPGYDFAADQPK